jgi:hypothetical protein
LLRIFLKAMRPIIKSKIKSLLYEYQTYISTRAEIGIVKNFLSEILDEIITEYIKDKNL